jgi:hypothetical protein
MPGKKFHPDTLLTILFFALIGTSFIFLTLIPFIQSQLIILALVTAMAIGYYKNWRDIAKIILGILIGFGSLTFGFVLYVIMSQDISHDAIKRGEPPPQRFDFVMIGPVFGLLFVMLALLFFFRFKTLDTTNIERPFSYLLLGAVTIATILSHWLNFRF